MINKVSDIREAQEPIYKSLPINCGGDINEIGKET